MRLSRVKTLLHFWPALLVLLSCVFTLGAVHQMRKREALAQQEQQVRENLSAARGRLDAVIQATFSGTVSLETLVLVKGDLSQSSFRAATDLMLKGQPQLRSVVAAPGDVVTFLSPIKGNEKIQGLDYRTAPPQWTQIQRARQLRMALIFAPVNLIQGGLGVVQRRPIFIKDGDGQESYWGSVSAVADLDPFMVKAGLPDLPISLAVLEVRADGQLGQVVWGATTATERALREDLTLPGATWALQGHPKGGWSTESAGGGVLLLGLLLTAFLTAASAMLTHRRMQLSQRTASLQVEVAARRASQQDAENAKARLQSLLSNASDWLWEQDAELRLSFISYQRNPTLQQRLRSNSLLQLRWEQPNLVPGAPSEEAWAAHKLCLQQRQPFRDFEYAIQEPGQPTMWLSISGSARFDAEGRFQGYRGIGRDVTATRSAEAALRASNLAVSETRDRLQAVMDASVEVAIIATDAQGQISLFNRGAERMLGYSAEEMLGQSPARLHLPAQVQERAASVSQALGRPIDGFEVIAVQAQSLNARPWNWTYVRKDGRHLAVTQALSCMRDAQGQIEGYLGIMIDISEQQAAAQHLQQTNARLQAMLDTSELAIVLSDSSGRVLAFNKGAERLTGYEAAELLGKVPSQLNDQEELRRRRANLEEELGRAPEPFELFARQARQPAGFRTRVWTYRHRNGKPIKLSMSMSEVRDGQGKLLGYLSQGRDIGLELAQQRALKAVSDRLQAVLDGSLDVAILVLDRASKVTLFNRGAEHLFGYAQHEMLGRSTLELLHERQELEQRRDELGRRLGRRARLSEVFLDPLSAPGVGYSQWTFVHKSGECFQGSLRLSRLPALDDDAESYLAIVLNMSEQVGAQAALEQLNSELEARVKTRTAELTKTLNTLGMAQEELLRADKLAALGAMVAGVAHELNTPIGTCLTAASTLEERTQEVLRDMASQQLRRSSLEQYLQEAAQISGLLMRGLGNASNLVTHFKQLSVDQTGAMRRSFHLDAVLADVLTVLGPQLKQSRLQVLTELKLIEPIDGYPGEMGRLLVNLILNAQLHAFEPDAEGQVRVEARPLQAGWFELSVQDNGMGMSAEVKRRAFDPFFTTKLGKGGSGLGLNIVYNIATAVLGGEVELRSEPGAGTTFVFRLPISAPQLKADAASAMQPTQLGEL
jgi:PAS domain S-box-containing protein